MVTKVNKVVTYGNGSEESRIDGDRTEEKGNMWYTSEELGNIVDFCPDVGLIMITVARTLVGVWLFVIVSPMICMIKGLRSREKPPVARSFHSSRKCLTDILNTPWPVLNTVYNQSFISCLYLGRKYVIDE